MREVGEVVTKGTGNAQQSLFTFSLSPLSKSSTMLSQALKLTLIIPALLGTELGEWERVGHK